MNITLINIENGNLYEQSTESTIIVYVMNSINQWQILDLRKQYEALSNKIFLCNS